jgi:uncharacterized membrane protein
MAVNQFGSVQEELNLQGFKTGKTPLYIVYNNRGSTKNQIMFFQNQVDVCLLFYRGKVNKEHLVNFNATLRTKEHNDLKNVKFYDATEKKEVSHFILLK